MRQVAVVGKHVVGGAGRREERQRLVRENAVPQLDVFYFRERVRKIQDGLCETRRESGGGGHDVVLEYQDLFCTPLKCLFHHGKVGGKTSHCTSLGMALGTVVMHGKLEGIEDLLGSFEAVSTFL